MQDIYEFELRFTKCFALCFKVKQNRSPREAINILTPNYLIFIVTYGLFKLKFVLCFLQCGSHSDYGYALFSCR